MGDGGGGCPKIHLAPRISKKRKLKHGLTIFYLSIEDIQQYSMEEQSHHAVPRPTIQEKITSYFEVDTWSNKLDMTFRWEEVKGIFLIPLLQPDQQVVYYCILNKDGPSNEGQSVKKTLRYWLKTIEQYNKSLNDQEIMVGSEDLTLAFLDHYCTFICKNVTLKTLKKEAIYKDAILEEVVSFA